MESVGLGQAIKMQSAHYEAITPSTTELIPCSLYVGTGGDLVVVDLEDNEITFANVQDGTFLPIIVKKVLATSTASDIVGLW